LNYVQVEKFFAKSALSHHPTPGFSNSSCESELASRPVVLVKYLDEVVQREDAPHNVKPVKTEDENPPEIRTKVPPLKRGDFEARAGQSPDDRRF